MTLRGEIANYFFIPEKYLIKPWVAWTKCLPNSHTGEVSFYRLTIEYNMDQQGGVTVSLKASGGSYNILQVHRG